jgi:hypothetical protein
MPFKEKKEGQTHHDRDACLKCKHCGSHGLEEVREIN